MVDPSVFYWHFSVIVVIVIVALAHFLQWVDQLDILAPHSWRGGGLRLANVVRHGQRSHLTELSRMSLPPKRLSDDALAEFDRRGFIVVRNALPRDAVRILRAAITEEFPGLEEEVDSGKPLDNGTKLWNLGHVWVLSLNTWMDAAAFADFVLHGDSPLGGLAAQLLGAHRVRMGGEALQGIWPHQHPYVWHRDLAGLGSMPLKDSVLMSSTGRTRLRPREFPCVRVFLPLAEMDIVANETGGSLEMIPLDSSTNTSRCVAGDKGACADSSAASVSPDLALGDLVMYSPLLWHRTQAMLRGKRVSYVATFFDPTAWTQAVMKMGSRPCMVSIVNIPWRNMCPNDGSKPFGFDSLGLWAHCWDGVQREFHYNFEFPSAYTTGVGRGGSACFPQVYPHPLPREVQARHSGEVQNLIGAYDWRVRLRKHTVRWRSSPS
mmetsp:Transcript_114603/g.335134  ORF Transcript_114603/g.335134 Transcript_114603/m.335134 type:complete len:435 (-) Transcript_114603:75-1379(-)